MSKQFTTNIIQDFRCKLTGEFFPVGSRYVADEERVQYLTEQGYADGATEVASSVSNPDEKSELDEFPKHVGGGFYELPNGEKVKGKETAEEAMKKLQE